MIFQFLAGPTKLELALCELTGQINSNYLFSMISNRSDHLALRKNHFTCFYLKIYKICWGLFFLTKQKGLGISSKPFNNNGEPCRNRTYDPLLKRQLLYRLS